MNKALISFYITRATLDIIAEYTMLPISFGERSNYALAQPSQALKFTSGTHALVGNDHLILLATPASLFPLSMVANNLLACIECAEEAFEHDDFYLVFLNRNLAIFYLEELTLNTSTFFLKYLGETFSMLPVSFEPKGGEC